MAICGSRQLASTPRRLLPLKRKPLTVPSSVLFSHRTWSAHGSGCIAARKFDESRPRQERRWARMHWGRCPSVSCRRDRLLGPVRPVSSTPLRSSFCVRRACRQSVRYSRSHVGSNVRWTNSRRRRRRRPLCSLMWRRLRALPHLRALLMRRRRKRVKWYRHRALRATTRRRCPRTCSGNVASAQPPSWRPPRAAACAVPWPRRLLRWAQRPRYPPRRTAPAQSKMQRFTRRRLTRKDPSRLRARGTVL